MPGHTAPSHLKPEFLGPGVLLRDQAPSPLSHVPLFMAPPRSQLWAWLPDVSLHSHKQSTRNARPILAMATWVGAGDQAPDPASVLLSLRGHS